MTVELFLGSIMILSMAALIVVALTTNSGATDDGRSDHYNDLRAHKKPGQTDH